MRVTEDARLCSVLLGWPDPVDWRRLSDIAGSAFIVAHESCAHIVTAKHVAQILTPGPFGVRYSDSLGGGLVEIIDRGCWHTHPDHAVDIAVMLVDLPVQSKTTAMHADDFVTDERVTDWEIGPGDAAYIVGLFNRHPGKSKNLPIVHAGHIALMPSDEKIPVEDKSAPEGIIEVEGYLVEAHALQGASGSPVMVRPTIRFTAQHVPEGISPSAPKPKFPESLAIAESRDFLLGVWVGAWPGQADETTRTALGLPRNAWVPVGMGIVIPAQRLNEILRSDQLCDERDEMKRKVQRQFAASQTGNPTKGKVQAEPADANPSHKEDFTALLGEAAQSPAKGD